MTDTLSESTADSSEPQCECAAFTGRILDVCLGEGRDGRPKPPRWLTTAFREEHGLEPLAKKRASTQNARLPRTDQTPREKISRPSRQPPAPANGPGTKFSELAKLLGVSPATCGPCKATMDRMNSLGAVGCRLAYNELVQEIRGRTVGVSLLKKITAGWHAIMTGLAFRLDPLDPIPGLLDEALRLAEIDEAAAAVAAAQPVETEEPTK